MAKPVVLSIKARRGFERITAYIGAVTGSRSATDRYRVRVMEALGEIGSYPERYPIYHARAGKQVRRKVLDNLTIILYREDNTQIIVEAIRDARSNWQGKL